MHWRRKWQRPPVFLTGESQGWEAWWAAVYGVAELNTTKVTQQHSSVGKDSACNAGDTGSIPGSGRSPAEGNGNPLQYSCLENPMDRGAWQATIHGVARVGHDLAILPNVPQLGFVSSSLTSLDFREENHIGKQPFISRVYVISRIAL